MNFFLLVLNNNKMFRVENVFFSYLVAERHAPPKYIIKLVKQTLSELIMVHENKKNFEQDRKKRLRNRKRYITYPGCITYHDCIN